MATRLIVPRSPGEGGLGTPDKPFGAVNAVSIEAQKLNVTNPNTTQSPATGYYVNVNGVMLAKPLNDVKAEILSGIVEGVLSFKGTVASEADLANIVNPSAGDAYETLDTLQFFAWDGAEWKAVGSAEVQLNVYGIPVGTILTYPSVNLPAGYLLCDGSAYSRTVYADLFAVIGTTYGEGDGSATFNVPDYRGVFDRMLDMGKGLDPDRTLGSAQGDAIRNITGGSIYSKVDLGLYGFAAADSPQSAGAFYTSNNREVGINIGQGANVAPASGGAGIKFDASRVVPTAAENRPVNMATVKAIKAFESAINQGSIDVANLVEQMKRVGQGRSPGDIFWTDDKAPPAGSLIADGRELSRTGYAGLWAKVQARKVLKTEAEWQGESNANGGIVGFYSSGDGASTFRVPNLTGAYLRGDAPANTGSFLGDAIRNITGGINANVTGMLSNPGSLYTDFISNPPVTPRLPVPIAGMSLTPLPDGAIKLNVSREVPTANENRPKSVLGIYCIQYAVVTGDLGSFTDVLYNKAGVDMDNLSAAGKQTISNMAAPSTRYVDLALPASEGTVTMPGNGWLTLDKAALAAGQFIFLIDQTTGLEAMANASIPGMHLAATLPVAKNDVVLAGYTATGATNLFRFVYAKGDE